MNNLLNDQELPKTPSAHVASVEEKPITNPENSINFADAQKKMMEDEQKKAELVKEREVLNTKKEKNSLESSASQISIYIKLNQVNSALSLMETMMRMLLGTQFQPSVRISLLTQFAGQYRELAEQSKTEEEKQEILGKMKEARQEAQRLLNEVENLDANDRDNMILQAQKEDDKEKLMYAGFMDVNKRAEATVDNFKDKFIEGVKETNTENIFTPQNSAQEKPSLDSNLPSEGYKNAA